MIDNNTVVLIAAILGSGGVGAVITAIAQSIRLARKGVSGREAERHTDIIAQRDIAWVRAKVAEEAMDLAEARAERERVYRIEWMEHATRLRIQLIMAEIEPIEEPPSTLRRIIKNESPPAP